MAYSTYINSSKGMSEFLNYLNYVTDMWISRLILLGLWFIILIGSYKTREDFVESITLASFGTFVVGLFFWLGGFVEGWTMGICSGALILSILLILNSK